MNPLYPTLIGAGVALVGGLLSQSIFLVVARKHEHNVLLAALRAELRVLREDLGASVGGFRESLRKGEWPTPSAFIIATPVFDANVGSLGRLRDLDLVDQIVETYTTVKSATEDANRMRELSVRLLADFNDMHLRATFAHLLVMKLHNRLLGHVSPVSQTTTEAETRAFVAKLPEPMNATAMGTLRDHRWT